MAIEFTPQQKNALKRIERACAGNEVYRYQRSDDRHVLREYLAALRHQDLYAGDALYPHDLPARALEAALRIGDPSVRLDVVRALLDTSHPPTPENAKNAIIGGALAYRAVNVIPVLAERGFVLTRKEIKTYAQDMGILIAMGEWPHLERIAPTALHDAGDEILMEVMRVPSQEDAGGRIKMTDTIKSLFVLDVPEDFTEIVSGVMAGFSGRSHTRNVNPDNRELVKAATLMIERGWLDPDLAIEEAKGTRHAGMFSEFISAAVKAHMELNTPSAQSRPSLMRL